MKALFLLLTIALIVPFMGCDQLNLDDPKITKLEARIAKLEEQATHWEKANTRLQNEKAAAIEKYNDLVTVNRALIAEKKDLADRLAMGILVIIEQDKLLAKAATKPVPTNKMSFKINFANNQLYNRADSRAIAKIALEFAKLHNNKVKITVEGYSSKAGDADLNMALSLERAEGVMFKIYEQGTDLEVEVIAHGETDDDERKVVVTVEVL